MEIYHGNIVYSESRDKIAVHPNHYIAVENGIVNGIYDALPEKFAALPVTDFGESVIIPAFSDLHVHAPQYPQRGLGSLEPGYVFDALVIRDFSDPFRRITPAETVERFCYTGTAADITARFMNGKKL